MVNVQARQAEVAEVDAFLAADKSLIGPPPEWKKASHAGFHEAIWIIEEEHGLTRAHLRFQFPRWGRHWPSVSVIFRDNPISRVDMVPMDECKFNGLGARAMGLPAKVCGPHCHAWPDNRDHLLTAGKWELPHRSQVPPQVRRVGQILPWLADQIRLAITPEQRQFDIPPQGELFGR